jgi:NADH:ubiquinone oxidoreductase subunit 3 (subunit A)
MTVKDYLDIVSILAFAVLFMCLGTFIMDIIGPNRIARWLRLPPYDYTDKGDDE